MSNKLHFFRQSSGGGGDAFIATFRTTSANETITLPYVSNGTYSGTIDFGDGTVVANTYANRTHTYTVDGFYTVTILGDCVGWNFGLVADSVSKIYDIVNWGIGFQLISSNNGYFKDCVNLDITATDVLDTSNVTLMGGMFFGCNSLIFNDSINSWDVSNVTRLDGAFLACYEFNQPLNNWDTSSVIGFASMFYLEREFNQDVSSWDFSSISRSNGLFNFISSNFSSMNSSYYDNLLIKWASDPSLGGLQPNIIDSISMGTIKYTANGASARASILANNKAQVINDGGQI
mgnify:CR=1 FL=1